MQDERLEGIGSEWGRASELAKIRCPLIEVQCGWAVNTTTSIAKKYRSLQQHSPQKVVAPLGSDTSSLDSPKSVRCTWPMWSRSTFSGCGA